MSQYPLDKGTYPYPLSYLLSDGGVVDVDFVPNNPYVAPDSTNWYVLCLTPVQLLELMSMIAIAAPIAFPDNYNEKIQLYSQMREYPNEIPDNSCMDICQLVLDCINNNTSIQEAIASYSLSPPANPATTQSVENLATQLINDPTSCDNDMIFGMTTGLVDLLNDVSLDIIELFANASSPAGRIGDLIEGIPVIGSLPVDDIFQFVESFINDINDAYSAAYTTALRDEMRCELFCIAEPNCILTLEDARNYYYSKLGEAITFTNFGNFVGQLLLNVYTGTSSIYAIHLLILEVLVFGGELVGIDLDRLTRTVNSLYNDPDSDWSTICDACEWISVLDFTVDDYGFVFDVDDSSDPVGHWVSGVGLVADAVDISTARTQVSGSLLFTATDLTSIRLIGSMTKGTFNNQTFSAVIERGELLDTPVTGTSNSLPASTYSVGVPTLVNLYKDAFETSCDEVFLFMRAANNGTSTYDGAATITHAIVTGTGTKPSELP